MAQLLKAGIITPKGRLLSQAELPETCPQKLRKRSIEENRKRKFILIEGQQTLTGEPIVLTQQDIREVQLAKGAIAAGIKLLMQTLAIQEEDIAKLLLAGAFGNYIDVESAVSIGLIPNLPDTKIRPVDNAAGRGAQLALLSDDNRQEADRIAEITEHLPLNGIPEFQYAFVEAMSFPESN